MSSAAKINESNWSLSGVRKRLWGSRKGDSVWLWQSCWFDLTLRIGQKQDCSCCDLLGLVLSQLVVSVLWRVVSSGAEPCCCSTLPGLWTGSVSCWYLDWLLVFMLVVTPPGLHVSTWFLLLEGKRGTGRPVKGRNFRIGLTFSLWRSVHYQFKIT